MDEKMKKALLGAVLIVLVGFVVFTNASKHGKASDADRPTVKIGVIAPLTGDNAMIGQNCRNGVEFALENIKDSKVAYKLIAEDDAGQLANAAKIANKLVNVDNVDILLPCSSNSGSPAVAYSKTNQKFMLAVIASAKEIVSESPYSFLHWTSPKKESQKAVELFKKNNVKKVVMLEAIHGGVQTLSEALTQELADNKIAVVSYKFQMNERNFKDIVIKARRDKADMFMILALPPAIDIIVKTLREKGIKTPYTSIEIPALLEDKSAFEGVEFVDVTEGLPEIIDAYKGKYNTENTFGVAFAYDAMMMINRLVNDFYAEHGRIPNAEEMTQGMFNLKDWNGAVGKVTVNPSKILDCEAVIKKIVNGKPVTLYE